MWPFPSSRHQEDVTQSSGARLARAEKNLQRGSFMECVERVWASVLAPGLHASGGEGPYRVVEVEVDLVSGRTLVPLLFIC